MYDKYHIKIAMTSWRFLFTILEHMILIVAMCVGKKSSRSPDGAIARGVQEQRFENRGTFAWGGGFKNTRIDRETRQCSGIHQGRPLSKNPPIVDPTRMNAGSN